MLSETDIEDHYNPSIRLIEIEKNNSQCGFQLTRGKWDPYPWVSVVEDSTAAALAGLKPGDCILEVNGEDILGKRICEVAEMVKFKSEVSLLLWNAGVNLQCTPEALCCGPLPRNLQRLSACLSKILYFLECPICLDTIKPPAYQCENGHLICIRCRTKTEKCPVCRLRLQRGRSLISDQIYGAIIDAFDLKEETEDKRTAKIHQIFKNRKNQKIENIPDIKITPSFTNKFLAKIVAKSTSVDNLSTNSSGTSSENIFIKAKSLSTNEIFLNENLGSPRCGSVSRLSKKDLNIHNNYKKPASYHGSYENLEEKLGLTASQSTGYLVGPSNAEEITIFCPFSNNCTTTFNGKNIFEHFQMAHIETGPLIQYFRPNIIYKFNDFQDDDCRIIYDKKKVYFLKTVSIPNANEDDNRFPCQDILIWCWFLGSKDHSKKYELVVELKSNNNSDVLLRVTNSLFSLNSVPATEIIQHKRGIFLSTKTLEALGFYSKEVIIDVSVVTNYS